jgi:hypothetical protein
VDPDPTPFFIDFKDAKKNIFSYFFLFICPQANHLQYKKFFAKILCKNDILQALYQSAQHIYEKIEGSGSGAGARSGSVPLTKDPDPGGPTTCGSCGSGSPTLLGLQSPSLTFHLIPTH